MLRIDIYDHFEEKIEEIERKLNELSGFIAIRAKFSTIADYAEEIEVIARDIAFEAKKNLRLWLTSKSVRRSKDERRRRNKPKQHPKIIRRSS